VIFGDALRPCLYQCFSLTAFLMMGSGCSKCECGTIYSMWIILHKYEGGCEARLARC